jgi:hypothetical protein
MSQDSLQRGFHYEKLPRPLSFSRIVHKAVRPNYRCQVVAIDERIEQCNVGEAKKTPRIDCKGYRSRLRSHLTHDRINRTALELNPRRSGDTRMIEPDDGGLT